MRLVHSSDFPPRTPANFGALLETVSASSLQAWVERIAVPRNFFAQRESNRATARWLSNELAAWGYHVQSRGPFENIVALPPKHPSKLILVGAHYDTVPQTPGADDNGSAVAALLACAQALARCAPSAPVCFVAFNGEENELIGSKDFVKNFLPQADFEIVEADVLEMVGFASAAPGSQKTPTALPIRIPDRGDFLGLLANRDSGAMLDSVLTQARTYLPAFRTIGLEVPLGGEKVFPVLARSDHVPFWNQGIPALMWTDTSEFRNPNYHRPTDTPDTVDYSFLRNVAQLLVACVAEQASLGSSTEALRTAPK